MALWKNQVTVEQVNALGRNTMLSYLGIEFIEVGDDFLRARMPVDHRTLQPYGIMHGGASCVLAETVGSLGASLCIDVAQSRCVGVEINTSHIRAVTSGWVIGTARPLHMGSTTHVWDIQIESDAGKLVSVTRLRLAIIPKSKGDDEAPSKQ